VAPGKILAIQVNDPDVVVSRVIETTAEFSSVELERVSERLTREFCGRTLDEVRRRLILAMTHEKAACDEMLTRALALGEQALEGSQAEDRVYVEGAVKLLDKPEFADMASVKRVFVTFDEKARLLDLIARYLDTKGTNVVLGSEEALASDPRLSAVLTSYGPGETLAGTLGVIGPARREYPRVIPVVELLGRALSDRLERQKARDREDSSE
jgi:heat-inducible transcriptional repressor